MERAAGTGRGRVFLSRPAAGMATDRNNDMAA